MSMEIKACTFISAADGTEWKIVSAGDGAVLSRRTGKKKLFFRSAEKKELGGEYLQNLDAFFGAFTPEAAPAMAAEGDLVRVICKSGTIALSSSQALPEGAEGLFDDLRRYFAACFAGTAEPVRLSFSSFDGGGPEFGFSAETGGVFTWTARRSYARADHDQLCGAGYDAIFTLYPLRKGSAEGLLTGKSPICPEPDRRVFVEVDDELRMTCRTEEIPEGPAPVLRKTGEFDGAWEEPGVIGTRIEIAEPEITVLWRNAPVLRTTFTRKACEGGDELVLKERGLRYESDVSDYAQLTGLFVRGDEMEMNEFFPISGKSRDVLRRTENSRYGNCDIVDELLEGLRGDWTDEHGFFRLRIDGDTLTLNDRPRKIHALRPRGGGAVRIADADPSVYEWEGISFPELEGGALTAHMLICDAPPATVVFRRADG